MAGDDARPGRRGAAESGPHRDAAPSESHRVSKRHPRPARSSTSTPRRSCRPTKAVTASTTSPSAICPRLCWTDISRLRRRSAGWRSAARRRSLQSDIIRVAPDLTQEEHAAGTPDRHARRGVDLRHTFAQDGEYDIQICLARGLSGRHRRAQGHGTARDSRAARPDSRSGR